LVVLSKNTDKKSEVFWYRWPVTALQQDAQPPTAQVRGRKILVSCFLVPKAGLPPLATSHHGQSTAF